jgi:ubiquinone biosynthesis protein
MFKSLRHIRSLKRYRRIVSVLARHGFGSALEFLQIDRHLSLPRRLLKQEPASRLSPSEHLRLALEELGPTFVKLGQILSTRPDLIPPNFIVELAKLRDTVPPAPWEDVQDLLAEEWGQGHDQAFANIEPCPIAAASLAQVHAATLKNGDKVVVKIQRPNILSTIETDLEILNDLAALAQRTQLGQVYDFVGIADDFAFTLHNELDYRREGRNADRFRDNFAKESYLYLPRVYWEFSTLRVLVMEHIRGIQIGDTDALDTAGYDRHKIALHSARIMVKEVLEDGFFHADPHPGNFLVMPGEVIGAMDFGMVGHLREQDRLNLIRLYLAAVSLDADSIVEQLIRMDTAPAEVNRAGLSREINRLLTKYQGLPLQDIRANEIVEEIMPIAFHYHLSLPSDLWLLLKTLAMMEGVGLELDPDFDVFAVAEPFMRRLAWQLMLPRRKWGQNILRQGADWGELLSALPRTGSRLLERAERGDLFQVGLKDADRIMNVLDRLTTRLALSVLAAALIIGLAMLIPSTTAGSMVQWMVVIGFLGAAGLGVWLLISIIKTER